MLLLRLVLGQLEVQDVLLLVEHLDLLVAVVVVVDQKRVLLVLLLHVFDGNVLLRVLILG